MDNNNKKSFRVCWVDTDSFPVQNFLNLKEDGQYFLCVFQF